MKLAPWDNMPADLSDATKVEQITQLGIDRATAVRQVLGPGRELLLDAHSKFDLARGLALPKRVEPLRLFWLEEVTPVSDLPAIRRSAAMPSAGKRRRIILDMGPQAGVHGFSLAPDGKSFMTSLTREHGDIWILDGFAKP